MASGFFLCIHRVQSVPQFDTGQIPELLIECYRWMTLLRSRGRLGEATLTPLLLFWCCPFKSTRSSIPITRLLPCGELYRGGRLPLSGLLLRQYVVENKIMHNRVRDLNR